MLLVEILYWGAWFGFLDAKENLAEAVLRNYAMACQILHGKIEDTALRRRNLLVYSPEGGRRDRVPCFTGSNILEE